MQANGCRARNQECGMPRSANCSLTPVWVDKSQSARLWDVKFEVEWDRRYYPTQPSTSMVRKICIKCGANCVTAIAGDISESYDIDNYLIRSKT